MASKEIWLPLVDWSEWFAHVTCNWSLTYTVQYSLSIGGDGKNLHTILDVGNAYRGPHTGCGWSCCRGVENGPYLLPKVEAFQNWGQQHQCQSLKRMRWFAADSCSNAKRWLSLQHLSRWLLMFGWYGAVMGEHFWKGETYSAVHTDLLDICHKLVSCAWVFKGSTCTAEFSGQMFGWISVCWYLIGIVVLERSAVLGTSSLIQWALSFS